MPYESESDSEYDTEDENANEVQIHIEYITTCGKYPDQYDEEGFVKNGSYHIGTWMLMIDKLFLVDLPIPVSTYYRFLGDKLRDYIKLHSAVLVLNGEKPLPLDIYKVIYYVENNLQFTACVIKTHWLRLVQRTWKRVYRERMRILKSVNYLKQRELGIRPFVPGLRGLLCQRYV